MASRIQNITTPLHHPCDQANRHPILHQPRAHEGILPHWQTQREPRPRPNVPARARSTAPIEAPQRRLAREVEEEVLQRDRAGLEHEERECAAAEVAQRHRLCTIVEEGRYQECSVELHVRRGIPTRCQAKHSVCEVLPVHGDELQSVLAQTWRGG